MIETFIVQRWFHFQMQFFLYPHDILSADWAAETAISWLRAPIPDSCDVTLKPKIKKEF